MSQNRVKPTQKQKKTLEIIKENPKKWDMVGGKKAIMIEGGFSPQTATHPRQNFIVRKGVAIAIEKWREGLRGSGLGEEKVKDKLAEWIDASKIKTSLTEPDQIVPDYQTQLKAGEMLRKDLGIDSNSGIIQTTQVNIFNRLGKGADEFVEGEEE